MNNPFSNSTVYYFYHIPRENFAVVEISLTAKNFPMYIFEPQISQALIFH